MNSMDRILGLEDVTPHRWFQEGLKVGALGAASVALWFLILDTIARSPLYTPAALGSVLFFGAQGPAEIHHTFITVWAYTILHFAAFMAVGALFVWIVDNVQSAPGRWMIAVMAFILLDGLFAGTLAMIGEWVIESVGVWAIAGANLVAVAVMGGVVWVTHPQLRHDLLDRPVHTLV